MDTFGVRLKDLIVEKQKGVEQISQDLDIDSELIYQWRTDVSIPKLYNLIKLADYFECPIDYLICRSENFYVIRSKDYPSFKEQLKFLMDKNNVSQYQICKAKKISKFVFRKWLSGKYVPLIDNLIKLADYFDCTVDYLVGRE